MARPARVNNEEKIRRVIAQARLRLQENRGIENIAPQHLGLEEDLELVNNKEDFEEKSNGMKAVLKIHVDAIKTLQQQENWRDDNQAVQLVRMIESSGRIAKNQWVNFIQEGVEAQYPHADEEDRLRLDQVIFTAIYFNHHQSIDLGLVEIELGRAPGANPQVHRAFVAFQDNLLNLPAR